MADPARTITVYGPDDQPVEVAASEAASLLRSGQYGLAENAAIPVQKADGSWETVSGAEAVARAQSFATRLGTEADVRDAAREEEFRGLGMKALAAGTGVVDSLALGAGDALLAKGADLVGRGGEFRQFVQDADRFAPGSRMAGQAAGFVAPLLATGGSSAAASGASTAARAARAVTALPRALTAVAEGAGGMAARAVGGGLPGRFVAPVVGQALELGVYGAGQGLSRTVIRDPQADGEALAAAMGRGFLSGAQVGASFGGLFGAGSVAVGLAGRGAERVAEAGRARLASVLDTGRGLEQSLARGELPAVLGERVGQGLDRATELAEQVTGRSAPAAEGLAGKADRLARTVIDVDKAAIEKAFQSTGATDKILQKAERLGSSREIAARQIVEELPRLAGKDGKVLTFAEQAEAALKLRREVGERVGASLDRLEATGQKIEIATVVTKAQKEVVENLKKIAGAESYAGRVEDYLASLESKATEGRMTLKEFHGQRSFLDDMVFEAKASNSPARKALERVRGIMEETFEATAAKAAKEAGSDAAAAYKAAKAEYRAAKWVEEATAKGAGRSNANRAIGFSEQVGALTGAVLGGGGITGLATSVASAAANRAIKQVGDQTTAAVLREMQLGKPLAEAVADVSRRNLGDKIDRFFELSAPVRERGASLLRRGRERAADAARATGDAVTTVGRAVGRGAQATARGAEYGALVATFNDRRRQVIEARAGGPTRAAEVALRYQRAGASPEAAEAAARTLMRGADLLAARLPPVPQRVKTLQPELATDAPDPVAMEQWLRLANIVDRPDAAIDYLAEGTLDAEEANLWREQWPSTYQQVSDRVALKIQEKTDRGETIPYAKALALGTLLDVVADPTLDPAFIAAMQAPPAPPMPPLAPSRRAASKAPELYDPGQEI